MVNFSGRDIDDDHIFQNQDPNDEMVSLPPFPRVKKGKGIHHQGGVMTQSVDMSSQHLENTKLSNNLEIQLNQKLKVL